MKKLFFFFLLLYLSDVCYSQVNLTQDLVAHYPFNGNANDVSGNNINGVVNNAALTTDRAGQPNSAYYFNGTSSYIQLPYSSLYNFAPNDSFTLCVRILPDQGNPWPAQSLVVKSPFTPDFNLSAWNYGTYMFNYRAMSGYAYNNVVNGTTTFTNDPCWYNIVTTYKNGIWRCYVNAVLESSDLTQTKFILQDGPASKIAFGRKGDSNGDWYKGKMDDIRIYHRILNTEEIAVLSSCTNIAPCDTWLKTSAVTGDYAAVGDLDVSGNKLTVEANFNRTYPVNPVGGYGFLVSKHTNPTDVNYAMWPGGCSITTVNGQVFASENCPFELNKTYHVAMVYDGTSLKYYRNGFLHSQTAVTGNLILNDLTTCIAQNSPGGPTIFPFLGYMNEVRIWNVARTQAQLQTYMNTSLPSPTTQTGLLGYWVFDNLVNKQGNTAYNGTLIAGASINGTNPNCTFTPDSCGVIVQPGISHIINDYTPVLALNPCTNSITVEDASAFNPGDTVLMIQMKGVIIDSTNTAAFGTITDYKNAGNYEYNYVKSKAGNIIELKNRINRPFDIPAGKVQLIRVPYYTSVVVSDTLSCLPWDGSKGAVLVFNVRDTLTMQANIDVTGKGFSGGHVTNTSLNATNCFTNDYFYPLGSVVAAPKGESIATVSNNVIAGKGNLASGGGGGLDHNSGGGGGGNATTGGFGGYQLFECNNSMFDNRGIGGIGLNYSNTLNRIYLGAGGGAGHCNNGFSNPSANTNFNGGNGGGIVLINSNRIAGNNFTVFAKGDSAYELNGTGGETHDGMGGGGSGGTVLIKTNQYISGLAVNVFGGKGGDMHASIAGGHIGPGGGGAGGVTWLSQASIPATVSVINNGGRQGYLLQDGNNPYGATVGSNGINLFNLVLPPDGPLFKPNIDSVRMKDSSTACRAFDFKGFGYTNSNPISSWQWYFGDGGTANTQNSSHTYATTGTFTVKLVVTDINGCKDSISTNVTSNTLTIDAGADSSYCGGPRTVQLLGSTSTAGNIIWTPAVYLNNSTIINPVATVNSTTTFYLNITTPTGCSGKDSITILISSTPTVQTLNDTAICKGSTLVLTTTTGLSTYHWSPGTSVNDSTISNPVFIGSSSQTLIITGTNAACAASDTINVTIKPLPVVKATPDTTICVGQTVTLSANGASTYNWSPVTFLSNPVSSNPVFSGNTSTTYYLTGIDINGCPGKDTITVNVNTPNSLMQPPNKSFCSKDTVHLDGGNGTNVQYAWSPATYLSNTSIINPVANPPASTSYSVTVTDNACNYDSTFTVSVTVISLPNVQANSSNDIDCALKNSQLSASGAIQYLWTPSSTLSNSSIANPVATPASNTEYIVTGTDITGCKNKDSVIVSVKSGINAYAIPNSFTPNGDGLNECFGIKHWGNATNVLFIIYSRWGEKVFETTNVTICWDGTYKGQPAEVGTYVYYAKGTTACGNLVKKGNLLLIR